MKEHAHNSNCDSSAKISKVRMMIRGLIFVLALAVSACGDGTPSGGTIEYRDLPLASLSEETGIWSSSPWNEGWLFFPDQSEVVIFHELGFTPSILTPYVSFHEDGTSNSLAAGDLTRIIEVTDTNVRLKNNTGEDFFLRIVLQ